jgi:hypothetical protein
MAASLLTPSNGAVAAPATFASASDFGAFEISEEQAGESVAAYGAALYDPWRFSGTPHSTIACNGFAKAHAANTQPFGATGGLTSAGGAAATLTADTGVTYAGTMGIQNVRLSHARLRAAVPLSWTLHNTADPTITWPTS